ncbi:ewing's tumor-associated antigen 1 isoform X2 [Pelmatolapia mariae]|uniref:ewing's tumor-associated antigen 1 isoform X2 n=1 Tax=Pelmatolapia mariae TaxID=158779 RepID=UPI002FE62304
MSGGRPKLGPLVAVMGTPLEEQQAAKPRANRLSRSSRQRLGSEQDSPRSQRAEFKTPTRIPRFRHTGSVCGESPHNDSDFQQDIIWDATSPSPNRRGKRGKTRPAGAVSISEIVSRIAPKHGRPEDADPTLQQWIGDSASIPCTPDVQPPKPKKKSPRPNAVDDLLKLAKQFDFNMFRQDEEEAEDMHQQSLELLSEDILDFENGVEIEISPSLPGSHLPAASVVAGTGVQLLPSQHMDDDLDFLFDGPTQYVSGNLSQASSAQSQVKPPREASGKPSVSSRGPTSAVSTPHGNGTSARNDFEDDWGDDDLLNDSLVLEMTQNPLKFASPKLCSTQKPAGQARYQREAPAAAGVAVGLGQSAAPKVEKENVRPRATFLLEPNPAFSVDRIQNAHRQVGYSSNSAGRDAVQSGSSSRRARQTCRSNSVKPDLQKPPSDQKRTSAGVCRSATSQNTNAPNFPQKAGVSSHSAPPADADFLDDDLDAFFLSEPVWDDLADDELLCEMCEDLESQIQGVAEKQAPLIGQIPNQSRALWPTGRTGRDDRIRQPAAPPPTGTGKAAGSSLAGGSASSATVKVNETLRFTGKKMASGSTVESACLQGSRRVQWAAALQRAPQQHAIKDQFTFKRPTDPVSTATDDVRGKCSAAEIERKKQQAMERRRQRLQAAQNLRDVT